MTRPATLGLIAVEGSKKTHNEYSLTIWGRLIHHNDCEILNPNGRHLQPLERQHTQHPTIGSPRTSCNVKFTDRDGKYAFRQLQWALFAILDFCSWGQCFRFQILLCFPELRCCPAKLLAPNTQDDVQTYLWPRTSVLAPPSFPNKEMFLNS